MNLSATTYSRVKDFFDCEHRGKIKTKDGRKLDMYFVSGVAPSLLHDETQPALAAFGSRYRAYFQKELKFPPDFLLNDGVKGRQRQTEITAEGGEKASSNKALSGDGRAAKDYLNLHRVCEDPEQTALPPAAPDEWDELVMETIAKRIRQSLSI